RRAHPTTTPCPYTTLFRSDSGKKILVPKGEDQGSGHRYTGNFSVVVRDGNHPVTKGMPQEWMHNRDELYDNMRGPIENVHLLARSEEHTSELQSRENLVCR